MTFDALFVSLSKFMFSFFWSKTIRQCLRRPRDAHGSSSRRAQEERIPVWFHPARCPRAPRPRQARSPITNPSRPLSPHRILTVHPPVQEEDRPIDPSSRLGSDQLTRPRTNPREGSRPFLFPRAEDSSCGIPQTDGLPRGSRSGEKARWRWAAASRRGERAAMVLGKVAIVIGSGTRSPLRSPGFRF